MMAYDIENAMVVDLWWDEQEYGVPSKRRLNRLKEAYDVAEMKDKEDGTENGIYL